MWYDPETWPKWLRWILLFPVALIAALAFSVVNNILNAILPWAPEIVMRAFVAAAQAVAFILLGTVIAPRARMLVAVILALVPIGWAALVLWGSVITTPWSWSGILYAGCYLGGAIYALAGARSFRSPAEG